MKNTIENLKNREKTELNGHMVERWGYAENDYGVLIERYGSKKRMIFPDAKSLAMFVENKSNGLTFLPPMPSGIVITVSEDAKCSPQDEDWRERPTGTEVLQADIYGYHYSNDDLQEFAAKETCFYTACKKRYTPANSFRVTIPAGTEVTYYDDEVRVNLEDGMKIDRLMVGWNPYEVKSNNMSFVGHSDRI